MTGSFASRTEPGTSLKDCRNHWEHHRYAVRDLDAIEAEGDGTKNSLSEG